jgi:hypothetical protein
MTPMSKPICQISARAWPKRPNVAGLPRPRLKARENVVELPVERQFSLSYG